MFTPAQVCEMTNVASSTLRKYVAQFHRHFSNDAQKQRGREFNQADLALVKKIKDLFSNGLSIAEINARLNSGVDNAPQVEPAPLTPEKQTITLPVTPPTSTLNLESAAPLKEISQPSPVDFSVKDEEEPTSPLLTALKRVEDLQQRQARQIETLQFDLTQTRAALNRLKDDQIYHAERYEKHLNTPWWKLLSRKNRR